MAEPPPDTDGPEILEDASDRPPRIRNPRELPDIPPIGWRDVACVAPLIVSGIWRLFSGTLTGLLLAHHALLLSFLRGSISSMIAAGAIARTGAYPLWWAMLVPIPILMIDDPFIYWAGRRYGRPLLNYLMANNPSLKRQLPRAERVFRSYSALAIIVANLPVNPLPMVSVVMFLAGETRMRFVWFLIVDFISLLIFTSFYVGIGWLLGDAATNVANTISRFGLPLFILTLGIILLITVRSVRRSMRQMREQTVAYEAQEARDAEERQAGSAADPANGAATEKS